jgi:hypothetical protein
VHGADTIFVGKHGSDILQGLIYVWAELNSGLK